MRVRLSLLLPALAALMALSGRGAVSGQEAIHSDRDLAFDFSALIGDVERPYLNYKTLSDSDWDGIQSLRIYGPELYTSFNSAYPYGGNDGALWQGRGINSSLSFGLRLQAQGLELTLKPQFVFSQNLDFELMSSAYPNKYGYIWGMAPGKGADAPQRFGNQSFYEISWGDSEIRYTWNSLTVGIGTQSPWLGPGRVNAIMHSNNASPYPKADLGLRRTPITLFGLYLGDIEARLWAGYLSESEYFDADSSNDHNLISALAVSVAPSALPGLSLFANRSYLAPWTGSSARTLSSLFFVNLKGGGDQDAWDQRASLGFDYLLPSAGIELYGEAGINDYAPSLDGYIRYPFRSMVYTGGFRKSVDLPDRDNLHGELLFEWSNLEMSQDFQFDYPGSFYMHHQIIQGYTNEGEWLGAAIGTGGNSQYLGFTLYYRSGDTRLYAQRINRDNDFIYKQTIGAGTTATSVDKKNFSADLAVGVLSNYNIGYNIGLRAGFCVVQVHNPKYDARSWLVDRVKYNYRIEFGSVWEL